MAILKEIYGPSVLKIKIEPRTFKHPTQSKTIAVTTVTSPFHIEINPGEAGNNDRLVIQTIIKELAQSPPIDSKGALGSFKVVILNEVDKLSKEAQHALRRTMEKCLGIRIPAPTDQEIEKVLQMVATKENFDLPAKVASKVSAQAKGNLRYALLLLEALKAKKYPFNEAEMPVLDWESFIIQIATDVTEEQSPQKLSVVRSKLYELIGHCIPPELIMKNLTLELLIRSDASIKHDIIHWAAFYEHRIQLGTKPIFHLEAFVAKFMSIYKKVRVRDQ
eukprot:gene7727-9057_t